MPSQWKKVGGIVDEEQVVFGEERGKYGKAKWDEPEIMSPDFWKRWIGMDMGREISPPLLEYILLVSFFF
jgi:hypothetical protein